MRDAVEGFTAAGGNAAFFGGNTAWWRVVFTDEVTFALVGFWHELGRPENAMIGVSFRHGGERDRTDHPVRSATGCSTPAAGSTPGPGCATATCSATGRTNT